MDVGRDATRPRRALHHKPSRSSCRPRASRSARSRTSKNALPKESAERGGVPDVGHRLPAHRGLDADAGSGDAVETSVRWEAVPDVGDTAPLRLSFGNAFFLCLLLADRLARGRLLRDGLWCRALRGRVASRPTSTVALGLSGSPEAGDGSRGRCTFATLDASSGTSFWVTRGRRPRAARRARPASGPAGSRAARRSAGAARSSSGRQLGHATRLQQPGEQGLLGVQPVLGLVPHDALRPVDDRGRDLLAAVGRQAVQHDGVGGGPRQRGLVDGVRARTAPTRSPDSPSCPIETQVSVASTSAPSAAACGSRDVRDRAAGRRGDLAGAAPGSPGRGRSPSGEPIRTCMPGRGAAEQVGVRHVVGAVAEVGQRAARRAPPCARARSAGRPGSGTGGTRR